MSLKSWVKNHPLKASSLVLILAAASIATTYAYLSTLPAKSGPQASIESYPLKLTVGLNKTEFALGENITINISLENVSNETITLTFYSAFAGIDIENEYHQAHFEYVITDINGTEICRWSDSRGALAVVNYVTLDPGQKLFNMFVWDQDIGDDDAVQIPVGTYHVRAAMPPGKSGGFNINSDTAWVSLETPSIMFTVG